MIMIFLISIGIFLCTVMVSRSETQINQNIVYNDLWNDKTKITINEEDQIAFRVVIKWDEDKYNGDDIRDVMNITFYHQSRGYNNKGFTTYTDTPLDFDFWSENDFKTFRNQTTRKSIGNEYEYCFNVSAVEIGGSIFNPEIFESIALRVSTWRGVEWIDVYNEPGDFEIYLFVQQRFIDLDDLDNTFKPVFQQIGSQNIMRDHNFYFYNFDM